ncbi:MAG: polysaccharide biosynthesis C-terminal domain-containing protein, partial [Romboutsia sp.]|nr:polysaccharide biosynthesis C-terminal domain-containing protein [Romboutsia sp.]
IAGSFVVLALVITLSYYRAPIMWVNFSYVIGGFITFFINLFLLSKFIDLKQSLEIDWGLIKVLGVQSLPLGIMFIFSQINFKADSILLSILPLPQYLKLTGTETVAVYNLPYKIFEVVLVIPTFMMNAIYPIFVRHLEENVAKFKTTLSKTLITLFVLGLIGSVFGYIFAPLIINLLGGADFQQSILVLRLLLVGLPIFYLSQPVSWLLVTLEKQNILPLIYFISAIFNFSLNLIYIPKYSFYASSMLTWVSEALILLLLSYFAIKALKDRFNSYEEANMEDISK